MNSRQSPSQLSSLPQLTLALCATMWLALPLCSVLVLLFTSLCGVESLGSHFFSQHLSLCRLGDNLVLLTSPTVLTVTSHLPLQSIMMSAFSAHLTYSCHLLEDRFLLLHFLSNHEFHRYLLDMQTSTEVMKCCVLFLLSLNLTNYILFFSCFQCTFSWKIIVFLFRNVCYGIFQFLKPSVLPCKTN